MEHITGKRPMMHWRASFKKPFAGVLGCIISSLAVWLLDLAR